MSLTDRQTHFERLLPLLMLFAMSAAAQSQFNYTNDNGQITITKYTGPGGAVIIPETIDGLPVTRIGDSAFYESTVLDAIVIANSVTTIADSAFRFCYSLTNVTIGNGVTNIAYDAFSFCTNLHNIVVPDNVITIGEGAFFSSGLRRAWIGDGVTTIGRLAFALSALKSITFGRGLARIGDSVFMYCPGLEGVCFKGNAPELGAHVFEEIYRTVIYYLPQTTGWGSTFGGRRALLWNPTILTTDATFGVKTGQFGFTISGSSNLVIVVEASADLFNPLWTPLATNTLTGGSLYFSDSHWTDYSTRVYRLRSP